jgi:hypothetical protein
MNVHRRLLALERKTRRRNGTLILPGGGTIVIQLSDWLGLTLAAMRRQYARISGSQASAGRFDRTLDLLERAIEVAPGCIPDEDNFDSNSTTIN